MLVDENKYGVFTDEEAPKKSITDCIGKCAVLLGVGADVHLGMFDDHKYVNERKAEVAGTAQDAGATKPNGNGAGDPLAAPKQKSHPDALGVTDYKAGLRAFEQERNTLLTALRGGEISGEEANDRYREICSGTLTFSVNGKEKKVKTDALMKQCKRSPAEWRDREKDDFIGFERRLKETREELDRALAKSSPPTSDDPFAPDSQEAAQ
jgi:hypothetical protein